MIFLLIILMSSIANKDIICFPIAESLGQHIDILLRWLNHSISDTILSTDSPKFNLRQLMLTTSTT